MGQFKLYVHVKVKSRFLIGHETWNTFSLLLIFLITLLRSILLCLNFTIHGELSERLVLLSLLLHELCDFGIWVHRVAHASLQASVHLLAYHVLVIVPAGFHCYLLVLFNKPIIGL